MKTLTSMALSLAMIGGSLAILTAQTGNRKVTQNAQSPPADTHMTIGGKKITIEYNAPSARGRKVEGGLIPYGSVWRLGADSATTLTTEADLKIGDLSVPAGVYTLYIDASPGGWMLVVNKQKGQWGTVYNKDQDLGRVQLKNTRQRMPVETLKISLTAAGGKTGTLDIEWGMTKASLPITVM
jgi:hypothetical protein